MWLLTPPLTHDKQDVFGQNDGTVCKWLWPVLYWWDSLVPMHIMKELTLETLFILSVFPGSTASASPKLVRNAGSAALPSPAWIKLCVDLYAQVIRMPIKFEKHCSGPQFLTLHPYWNHVKGLWDNANYVPTFQRVRFHSSRVGPRLPGWFHWAAK